MNPLTPVSDPVIPPRSGASAQRPGAHERHAPSPEVLRCTTTADFLAALPVLAGFTAENSLFIVCFEHNRGGNVMRVNLPESDEPHDTKDFLDLVVSLLRQTGAGSGRPAVVITTNLSFAETDGVPRGRLAHQLKRCFRREGWRLRELAVVASDGWCGLLHGGAAVARPLSEIQQSHISARVHEQARSVTDLASMGALPEPDIGRAASIEFHLRELQQRRLARSTHPASSMAREDRALLKIRQASRVAEACFAAPAPSPLPARAPSRSAGAAAGGDATIEGSASQPPSTQVPDRLLAKLIDTVQTQTGWLVCVLTALTRSEFVVDVAHETGAHRITDIHVDSLPGTKPGTKEGWNIRYLLTSLAHEIPPKEKLRRVITVVTDALAHAPEALRPSLFAVLAWAWWAVGMQSVAARRSAEGLSLAPDHEVLLMVSQLCEAPPSAHLLGLRDDLAHAA